MTSISVKTRLTSDIVTLPELRHLVGKDVEICVTEIDENGIGAMLDTDYHAECEADTSPEITLEEVRAALSSIPGTMTGDFLAERDER